MEDTTGWSDFKHTNSLKEKRIEIRVERQNKDDAPPILNLKWRMEYMSCKKKKSLLKRDAKKWAKAPLGQGEEEGEVYSD